MPPSIKDVSLPKRIVSLQRQNIVSMQHLKQCGMLTYNKLLQFQQHTSRGASNSSSTTATVCTSGSVSSITNTARARQALFLAYHNKELSASVHDIENRVAVAYKWSCCPGNASPNGALSTPSPGSRSNSRPTTALQREHVGGIINHKQPSHPGAGVTGFEPKKGIPCYRLTSSPSVWDCRVVYVRASA